MLRFGLLLTSIVVVTSFGLAPPMVRAQAANDSTPEWLVVVGAGGTPDYETMFQEWSRAWENLASETGVACRLVGTGNQQGQPDDKEQIRQAIEQWTMLQEGPPLFLVLLGHGTAVNNQAKFNLRGPDLSDQELSEWLKPVAREVVLVSAFSSGAPFLKSAAGQRRVVVSATQSGAEQNFSRFGQYLAAAIHNLDADLDHDDSVSLLEAFLAASRNVEAFYRQDSRLATEHAIMDDNGDGFGTPADFFAGVRAVKSPSNGQAADGLRAHQLLLFQSPEHTRLAPDQLAQRDALEQEIEALRQQKAKLSADDYYAQLESLLVKMAEIYLGPQDDGSAQDDRSE